MFNPYDLKYIFAEKRKKKHDFHKLPRGGKAICQVPALGTCVSSPQTKT